jgi:hypothetical protein
MRRWRWLPPVTEVKRLRLAPGDALVVRCPDPLPAAVVSRLEVIVRRVLRVPAAAAVLVLDNGVDIDVVEASRADDLPGAGLRQDV